MINMNGIMKLNDSRDIFDSIMERYEGNTDKRFKQCEIYCQEIIDIANTDWSLGKTTLNQKSKPIVKLEETLASIFNIERITIYFTPGGMNAFTLCNGYMSRSNNMKYMRGEFIPVKIFISVLLESITKVGLTARELMAVILHEIGHNLYYCPLTFVDNILSIFLTLGIVPLFQLIVSLVIRGYYNLNDVISRRLPGLTNLIELMNRGMVEVNLLLTPLNIAATLVKSLESIRKAPSSLYGYGAEKAADSFCAKYGYAADQVSALEKFRKPENTIYTTVVSSGPLGQVFQDSVILSLELCSLISFDVHPSNNQRAQAMLNKLKEDYSRGDFPPSMKKELKADIDYMEKMCKSMYDINSSKEGPDIRKGIYEILNRTTKGKTDIRELFNFYYDKHKF